MIALNGRFHAEGEDGFRAELWAVETRDTGGRWTPVLESDVVDDVDRFLADLRSTRWFAYRVRTLARPA